MGQVKNVLNSLDSYARCFRMNIYSPHFMNAELPPPTFDMLSLPLVMIIALHPNLKLICNIYISYVTQCNVVTMYRYNDRGMASATKQDRTRHQVYGLRKCHAMLSAWVLNNLM